MAINPESQYPGKIAPASPDYPYGAARNVTLPGDGTGTPWEAALVNDLLGFQQALLSLAGVVPSGTPDKVGGSQYLQAIQKLIADKTTETYTNTADMIADTSIALAEIIQTRAFSGSTTGVGSGVYITRTNTGQANGADKILLDNGAVAELLNGFTISQFGDNVTAATAYGKALGVRISLENREVVTTGSITDDMYDWLFDGFIDRFNILYPVNVWGFNKSVVMTQDQGPELNYNAWPQGKVYKQPHQPGGDGQSKLKLLVNRGSSHQADDLTVWSMESQDGFNTLSEPLMESGRVNFTQGNTAWSAGTDGTRQYFITRERGANYNIGISRHFLNYATTPESIGGYVRKLIDFDDGAEVPVLFHSFAKLGNNKLAVGYQFTSGEVGLAFTDSDGTVGDVWTKSVMFAAGSTYVEPSVLYDADNSATVGFLRTQNSGNPPQFYVSTDNGVTFSFSDVTDLATGVFLESPINIAKANGNYYALVTERTGDCRMYLLVAGAADAIANGFSAFKRYYIGNSNYSGSSSSGAGAGDLYADDEKVVLFYGEHGNTSESVHIVKMDITFDKIKDSSARYLDSRTNAIVSKEFKYDLTSLLESQWSAEDSGEGADVNGGGLFAYKRGSKLRLVGYLKTTDASAPIITLAQHLHPWASHKPFASYNDTTFTVNLFRGVLTSGLSGELKLLNATGAQSKVMIDFEVDLLR